MPCNGRHQAGVDREILAVCIPHRGGEGPMEHIARVEFEGVASTPALADYFEAQAIALQGLAAGMDACLIRVTGDPAREGRGCRFRVRIVIRMNGATLDACEADENLFVALRFACLSMRCRIALARRRLRRTRQRQANPAARHPPLPRP
jgi:hypothetical protein